MAESNRQQQQRKQSTVDTLTENISRAIRNISPEGEFDRGQRDIDRIFEESGAFTPLSATPSFEDKHQQELLSRVAFLNDLK